MTGTKHFLLLTLMISLFACGSASQKNQKKYTEKGKASWYGKKFNGKKTASGETFNMRKLTAAHKTLPFGTKVKVTNLSNKKSVVVRINDRGPHSKSRIIDLSKAAAAKIDLVRMGVANVVIEVVK